MSKRPPSRLPLYSDSDLNFILPNFLISEFFYARSLEKDVILGQDPEFNHQYRVTLRRMRSLSLLLKELLPQFERKLLKPNLKLVMKKTNLLRDLDVFIMDKARYVTMLPEHKASLERMFTIIEDYQFEEQQRVADWLTSRRYLSTSILIENSLRRALRSEDQSEHIDPLSFANNKIVTQFRRVSKSITKISDTSEDSDIHALRIKCKSLRYLLECFSALYSKDQHKDNVKQLKLLQDKLGNFNDTSTQIAFFSRLRRASAKQKEDRKALKALIKEIKNQHRQTRQTVVSDVKLFHQFLQESSALDLYRV
ncbi:metal-binding protein [Vibrio natriegens]|uniref:CHAD domain-containing protein n=1 Tax=Vibrio natriegens TaxID=691 RepID=UPI000803C543|nr:CHAD domain-containing protein [Vibrio natriegens]ANQ24155.1 metal-binding protein [Vibrio natriegens]ANQ29292.1 metal-binding protein [Vibrio natriegens]MCY9878719.1 CHAD domain-containing protein [Vibrio natriegens]